MSDREYTYLQALILMVVRMLRSRADHIEQELTELRVDLRSPTTVDRPGLIGYLSGQAEALRYAGAELEMTLEIISLSLRNLPEDTLNGSPDCLDAQPQHE